MVIRDTINVAIYIDLTKAALGQYGNHFSPGIEAMGNFILDAFITSEHNPAVPHPVPVLADPPLLQLYHSVFLFPVPLLEDMGECLLTMGIYYEHTSRF